MPNPSCQGAASFPITQQLHFWEYSHILMDIPHVAQLKASQKYWLHENPGKLKFQKLLFTQVEWKLFSVVVTCSNYSQRVWNKQINSFSPGKAGYSHCQCWSADWYLFPSVTFVWNSKIQKQNLFQPCYFLSDSTSPAFPCTPHSTLTFPSFNSHHWGTWKNDTWMNTANK